MKVTPVHEILMKQKNELKFQKPPVFMMKNKNSEKQALVFDKNSLFIAQSV